MLSKLLPVILMLAGIGGGIGAGIALSPAEDSGEVVAEAAEPGAEEESSPNEFVKIANQFVVPVVKKDRVTSHVVLSLNLEVAPGSRDSVFPREPKLRASFLRVLFDHANVGGFQGSFTKSENLDPLREALLETARLELGKDVVDVLIVDIARQDAR
jgi:hypothetical protein